MVPECGFILSTGRRCRAVALRGKAYCHAHMKSQSRRFCRPEPAPAPEPETQPEHQIEVPVLLDIGSIMATLNEILYALGANRISSRRANLLMDGLRMTMANLDRITYNDTSLTEMPFTGQFQPPPGFDTATRPLQPPDLKGVPI